MQTYSNEWFQLLPLLITSICLLIVLCTTETIVSGKHIPNAANKLVLRILVWVPYAAAQSSKLFSLPNLKLQLNNTTERKSNANK